MPRLSVSAASRRLALCIALLLAAPLAAQPAASPLAVAAWPADRPYVRPGLARWIAQRSALYRAEDAHAHPAPGGIVLVGSSFAQYWESVRADLALPVLNRGIASTRTDNQLDHIRTLALRYRPRAIVFYCGINDLNEGIAAPQVAANIVRYAELTRRALPDATLVVVSLIHSPGRRDRWDDIDTVNALVRAHAERSPEALRYIDVAPALETAPRQPRAELFKSDGLHLRPAGYAAVAALLRPVLQPS